MKVPTTIRNMITGELETCFSTSQAYQIADRIACKYSGAAYHERELVRIDWPNGDSYVVQLAPWPSRRCNHDR